MSCCVVLCCFFVFVFCFVLALTKHLWVKDEMNRVFAVRIILGRVFTSLWASGTFSGYTSPNMLPGVTRMASIERVCKDIFLQKALV